ncbi:zf-HC2 domain-containing protein [Streptomyces gobiensis]|uniref:zf-HC2 domain-containing protein n=1 Tax=Streptomyces gobiensis TaxID=2875706 RepID=UPI001E35DB22|nr:zf-HC2 domain-containing protein [Streptomyces gobiensis]UGY92037.1 zf-HC2 domain-containing protein [Streptomyces gobiensis]
MNDAHPGRFPDDEDPARSPRIPPPRAAADDGPAVVGRRAVPQPRNGEELVPEVVPELGNGKETKEREEGTEKEAETEVSAYDHGVLKSLLGAWALSACSAREAAVVEAHLTDCASCAEEALRLRDAVGLLHPEDTLDLNPGLRSQVLAGCLGRRPPRIPIPEWATPYDAETARLDALLEDMGDSEWETAVRLHWADGERYLTMCGVLAHLGSVDGIVAVSLGIDDPLGPDGPRTMLQRTDAAVEHCRVHPPSFVRNKWRTQTRGIVRTLSFAGAGAAELPIDFIEFTMPTRDAMISRAFACWIHADDIATAVDYPYPPPAPAHLKRMVDLAARKLPGTLADRRRSGLAAPPRRLTAAGAPGRALHLEVEGDGGGDWYIPLDSPAATASAQDAVAHVALDGLEFCQLAAGHVPPQDAAAGAEGDPEAIRDVLSAAASLSRL